AVSRSVARPVPMTYAPASRASWVAIEPTTPDAPWTRTLCPARRRPCSNSPCHAVRPGVTRDARPRTRPPVLEQPLPRGQARHHEGRAHREVNVARQRREVACLDGYILRQRAVASPVREAEPPLSHRQPRRSIAEGGDHSGQLVARDRRRPVTAEAVDPGRGPRQLIPGESRRMNLNNDIAV